MSKYKDRQEFAPVPGRIAPGSLPAFRRLRPVHLLGWLLGVVLLLAAAYFLARPIYRKSKQARGRALALEVQRELGTARMEETARKVKLMLGLAPHDPEVWRAAAWYCASNQMPEALNYQKMLWDREPYDRAEHLNYLRLALELARYDLVAAELETLLRQDGSDPEVVRVALQLATLRRHWPLTARLAERLLVLRPEDGEAQLRLGQALASAGRPAAFARARAILMGLVLRPGEWQVAAWQTLAAAREQLTRDEALLLAGLVGQLPAPTVELQLQALSLRGLNAPAETRRALRAEAVKLAGDRESSESLAHVAAWLLQEGGAAQLLELLPLDFARGRSPLIRLHVAALLQLGRHDDILALADDPGSGLEPHLALAARAVVVGRGKPRVESDEDFRRIVGAARRDAQVLVELAELAEAEGHYEAALAAWEPLLEVPRLLPTVAGRMLALAARSPLLETRVAPLRRLLRAFPLDRAVLLELAYVTTVIGPPETGLLDQLRAGAAGELELMAEATLALAEARGDRAEAALDRLDRLALDWDSAPPRLLLVRAYALGRAGASSEAGRLAKQGREGGLHREELRLLETWLPAE